MSPPIAVRLVGPRQVAELRGLLQALASAERPQDPQAPEQAAEGLERSLDRYDFTRSDAFWMVLARVGNDPAGYAAVCRVPKADARGGFLFVDELQVLRAWRRRGVATALLARVEQLANELGLGGVRLLVRPQNEAARRLYRSAGFVESDTLFCEKKGSAF